MAAKTLAIRDAIVTALAAIGNNAGVGWESGSGTPTIAAGQPPAKAIDGSIKRQLFVQHAGTEPKLEGFTAGGCMYRAEFYVWVVCPDVTNGEDLASQLERDVRRAIQLVQKGSLEIAGLANAGIYEGFYEIRPELQQAGPFMGIVHVFGEYLTTKGDP